MSHRVPTVMLRTGEDIVYGSITEKRNLSVTQLKLQNQLLLILEAGTDTLLEGQDQLTLS